MSAPALFPLLAKRACFTGDLHNSQWRVYRTECICIMYSRFSKLHLAERDLRIKPNLVAIPALGRMPRMTRRLAASAVALAALWFLPVRTPAQDGPRQPGAVYDVDKKGEKPAPAPKRGLTG